ncbi:hypothetical protein [Leptospira andrefontaineae]|uniref:Uncharacterized protein n=1 Tax=Leptospira andrefontaineae TaxID=2484976 RepID=A0A4R9GWX8_9LEPT|nr:hypothetical protein [Leptospira andrefontaineae]TGK36275.1 hypothetical protein EHO65_18415 [Leptospira andrefontaineae]
MISASGAKSELEKFANPKSVHYQGDVQNEQEAKDAAKNGWANALYECTKSIEPPSQSALAAKAAFLAAVGNNAMSIPIFQAACNAFATTLGNGMTGHVATPPPTPFLPSSSSQNYDSFLTQISQQLGDWFSTGLAAVPPSAPEPWA